jgi:hypothetical protein
MVPHLLHVLPLAPFLDGSPGVLKDLLQLLDDVSISFLLEMLDRKVSKDFAGFC